MMTPHFRAPALLLALLALAACGNRGALYLPDDAPLAAGNPAPTESGPVDGATPAGDNDDPATGPDADRKEGEEEDSGDDQPPGGP